MTLEYSLYENDFLQHQLYVASKTKSVEKQRRKTWLIMTIAYLVIGFSFYNKDKFAAYLFFIFSAITLFFFPLFQKFQYRKHYKKCVLENYKLRFGQISIVSFIEDKIEIKNSTAESKINYDALEEIGEIADYFFLKIKTGGGIIIPKKGIQNMENFRVVLSTIKEKYKVKEVVELNWKWK